MGGGEDGVGAEEALDVDHGAGRALLVGAALPQGRLHGVAVNGFLGVQAEQGDAGCGAVRTS
ncbi:hypothetical protein [Actinokineospora inagensis]|uniref:hypothetical protein n=1 Tax=Actinokineospora inagensis TaxID=103730 RepID=UPI00047D08DA